MHSRLSTKVTVFQLALVAVLAVLSTTAFATNSPPPKPAQTANAAAFSGALASLDATVNSAVAADISNTIRSTNTLSNEQAQGQSQRQDQSQVQSASSTATNAGNAQTINFNQPGRLRLYNVPDANAPPSYPTAPCRIAGSAGGSWVGGGLSFGGSKQDPECDKRETARAFANLGQNEAALLILCSTAAAKEALGEDCAKFKADPVAVPPPPQPAQITVEVKTESDAARRAREDRIVRKVLGK